MTIREFIISFCRIPVGIEFGWVALIVSKFMRARTGEDRWDVEALEGDDDWREFTYRGGEAGVDYGLILRALCDQIAGEWKGCDQPESMEFIVDLMADTGWDIVDAAIGLGAHDDSHVSLTEGGAVGYACQHVINLSWAYRWWKRINGEDEEFNAEFGYGSTPNKHLEALGAAARASLDKLIDKQKDEEREELDALRAAAKRVLDNWESGDLADAVTQLGLLIDYTPGEEAHNNNDNGN